MKEKLTDQEILDKINEFDFEKLMEPYREGGSKDKPIARTMGMIVDWLVNRKKYSVEVAGGAILLTFMRIMKEGHFKGDGTFGSAGNELDQNIRQAADVLNQKTLLAATYKKLAEGRAVEMKRFMLDTTFRAIPWFVRLFSIKYWKYRGLLRKERKSVAVQRS